MAKILYITPGCFDKGGISRYNRYQIKSFRELYGEENVKVLSLLGPDEGDFETAFSVNWHGSGNNAKSRIILLLKVFCILLFFRPQVCWIAHVNFSGIMHFLCKLLPVKVVSVLNVYGLEVWSGLSKDAAWGLKQVDYVVSDCHYTARYVEENNFRKENTTEVIWDCVDLNQFRYNENVNLNLVAQKYSLPNPENNQLIVSLGRIAKAAKHKGYDRLIKTFKGVSPSYPNAKLVLAGKGDWVEELKALIAELGLTDQVYFTGPVDEEDMASIYQMAYVFSLVSDRGKGRGEGIPLTPLEAMACRVPIMVGNQDGSQEAIFENSNGYLLDPFDLDKHAQAIMDLLNDSNLRNKKAFEAERIARNVFSYDGFKEKHFEFVESL